MSVTLSPRLLCLSLMGERYRREMLAHGGAKEPMLMVEGNHIQPLLSLSQVTNMAGGVVFLVCRLSHSCACGM